MSESEHSVTRLQRLNLTDLFDAHLPNFRTVKRRVEAIDAKEDFEGRAGAKAANDRFRPIAFYRPLICFPLERVQIDHTQVDVILVDAYYPFVLLRKERLACLFLGLRSRVLADFQSARI